MSIILIIQFIVGVVQVIVSIIALIYQLSIFKTVTRRLERYFMLVGIYFTGLFSLEKLLIDNQQDFLIGIAYLWFFSAWGIAFYWFKNVIKWFKKI